MGFTSIWHWLIVLMIVVLIFGAGKLPRVMGDLAKGIKNFKAGLQDENAAAKEPPAHQLDQDVAIAPPPPAQSTATGAGHAQAGRQVGGGSHI